MNLLDRLLGTVTEQLSADEEYQVFSPLFGLPIVRAQRILRLGSSTSICGLLATPVNRSE